MKREMYTKPQSVDKYLDIELVCRCGRTHYAPIKDVEIRPGAIETLPELIKKHGYSKPFIVCDEMTNKIAGERCGELIAKSGLEAVTHIISHLGFDEATLGELVVDIPVNCDLIIAVGTGSISDMVRFMSYKLRLPCFTVATAAPMDGFAASIGIMNVNNLKATMEAHNSQVIIGDTDILQNAPYRMSIAGFGDLIGKVTCMNDWELAALITGEHICPDIIALVRRCVSGVMAESKLIKEKDPHALGNIMSGLVLSGAAISLYGDSRPASGAEHHMSHYWETVMEQHGLHHAMHGEQVAVGTVLVLMMAEELKATEPDFDAARAKARSYDGQLWADEIKKAYGLAAGEIIALEDKTGKNRPENVLRRIDSMEEKWPRIIAQLDSLPDSRCFSEMLKDLGCPCNPAEIGIDAPLLKQTFMYCKEVRPRYTIFQTAYDLGLLDSLSDRVIAKVPW